MKLTFRAFGNNEGEPAPVEPRVTSVVPEPTHEILESSVVKPKKGSRSPRHGQLDANRLESGQILTGTILHPDHTVFALVLISQEALRRSVSARSTCPCTSIATP